MNVKQTTVNTIRVLSAEAIQKANSGHPGIALGSAPIAYTLWADFLKFNSKNPKWDNRDRFILSAGHGSIMNYMLLYLFGFGLKIDDIKNFRQLDSKTPGHPEYGHTAGIETTTGPLGQGIANAVGMALAESHLSAIFNKDGFPVVDHYTYALCGDGCLEEGISYEACSFAGANKLGKLILLYDKNDITIEGDINATWNEDVAMRFKAQGWQTITVEDANDLSKIKKAITKAQAETEKPSIIICKTQIGYGSPLVGKSDCHGAPLGDENIKKLKEFLGWEYAPFETPATVLRHCKKIAKTGALKEKEWDEMFAEYAKQYPELAKDYKKYMEGYLPDINDLDNIVTFDKPMATRVTSSKILNKLADIMPNLIGGSADLAPSNNCIMTNRSYYSKDNYAGSNVHFGIREHAMAGITNGMQLHGGLRAYCATFFTFSDYMKHAMRLAALMNIPVTYILTHDSIGVGEDGPTHEPIEHLINLRSIPNINVFRPADGKETIAGWKLSLSSSAPTALILSRQGLPQLENSSSSKAVLGGYILDDSNKKMPDVILIASGSEVELCVKAKKVLSEQGVDARVVSMPCIEQFEKQTESYKNSVLPQDISARVCVEAGSPYSWYKYAGLKGKVIGMTTFGASAPANELFVKFGITTENVVDKALKVIKK